MAKASDNQYPKVTFAESAAPSTPASGLALIYVKADGKLYLKDDAGTETDLTATGGGGTDYKTLLSTNTLGSDTASVSFSGISSAYDHLRFEIDLLESSRAASVYDAISMQVGASTVDTGSVYNWTNHRFGPSGAHASASQSTTFHIGDNTANTNWIPAASAAASSVGHCVVDIFNYVDTDRRLIEARAFGNNGSSGSQAINIRGQYIGSQAIDIVTFTTVAGANFLTGGRFRLFGLQAA